MYIQTVLINFWPLLLTIPVVRGKFSWQEGYGAFSYGHSQLDTIIRYIQNQEQHHRRRSFKDEYLAWLKKFEIPFEEIYVFQFIE